VWTGVGDVICAYADGARRGVGDPTQ
jgi:hypothetical protein